MLRLDSLLLLFLVCPWKASTQDVSSLPACGQICVENELGLAKTYDCSNGDTVCLCNQQHFIYGVRDCANQACPSTDDASATIAYVQTLCQGVLSNATSTTNAQGQTVSSAVTRASSLLSSATPPTSIAITATISEPATSQSVPAATTTTSPGSSTSSGLSKGAKVGIGVGVPIGVILVTMNIALLVILARRRNRDRAAVRGSSEVAGERTGSAQARTEHTHEIDGTPVRRYELPTKANTAEMAAMKEKEQTREKDVKRVSGT